MKKLFLLILILTTHSFSQSDKSAFGITFSGFVKTDLFFDTRQGVSSREGHALLYPANEKRDAEGNDINDKASFNILSIQSRLSGKITGPDALGAKTSGLIEGEFFGHSESDVNGFRLRHALVKLDWGTTSLMIGQYWHPMYVPEVIPSIVSYNNGTPFQPFSRNPQIRFVQSFDKVNLIFVAASQRDFTSTGPNGFSSTYLREAVMPNLHFQIQYAGSSFFAGVGIDYKKITPQIVTNRNYKTDASLSTLAFTGYAKITTDDFIIKGGGTYGGNLTDQTMLGGYAVKSTITATGVDEYTALNTFAVWGEFITGKQIEFGLFGGFTQNLGADDNVARVYYARGNNIASVFRVAPRMQFNLNSTRLSAEVEYTEAAYGIPVDNDKGKVANVKSFNNFRVVLAAYYFF